MNRKWIGLIIVVIFLPAILAGVWYLSVVGVKLTTSNVSVAILTSQDKQEVTFTSNIDKEFFIDLYDELLPIEKQDFDSEEYVLYQLEYKRIQGDITLFLCLSADTKNCLAYDSNNNWYRIRKEDAQKLLLQYQIDDVYKYSNVPHLRLSAYDVDSGVTPIEADWNYLVADDSYKNVYMQGDSNDNAALTLSSLSNFDLFFEVEPDWYSVKFFDGDLIVYDGLLDNPSDFNLTGDCELKAVVSAQWYNGSNRLYYGEATYEFDISYDVPASYVISKDILNAGEVLYLIVHNADDEIFDISCQFLDEDVKMHDYSNGQLAIVPIPMDVKTGEYTIDIRSAKSHLTVSVTVNAKSFGKVKVGLIKSENGAEYDEALKLIKDELSPTNSIILKERFAFDGWLTPVQKFVEGKEQYWISAPSYGVAQIVNGSEISQRNFGVHYVKSVDATSLNVRAVAQGIVAFSGNTTAYGNTVVIEHGYGIKSLYGHLGEVSVAVGDEINRGDVFAIASPEAFSIASKELFFAVYVNGNFVNPFNFINEPRKLSDSEITNGIEFFVNR